MKKDIDAQFLCKDCENYGFCRYYHNRKEYSYICKYFHLPNKLDKIRAEIEQYQSDYDEHGTEYDRTAWKAFNLCLQILDKYKAENEANNGKA